MEFSDGTIVCLERSDIVLIVGPNNAGKSAALRAIRDKLAGDVKNPVVASLSLAREGSEENVIEWLESFTYKLEPLSANPIFSAHGSGLHLSNVRHMWSNLPDRLDGLARFFSFLLTADERLNAANPVAAFAVLKEAPSHPIHHLYLNDGLELKLSKQFRKAFGKDLVVNRLAGREIPLHVGDRPQPAAGEDRLSMGYVEQVGKLDSLHLQGDGMRSFAGVLLHTSVGRESILSIDEPEAFLHPPQAKLLGRMLVADKPDSRQVFIATHSGDILRGVLDAGSTTVRVLRIQRRGEVNRLAQLDNAKISQLWNDPLLRYSNILDGLFHEKVIVCEADGDARFYAAVADALNQRDDELQNPDVMFTHCGGKHRIPVVVRALREVDVPVNVVVDFDILNSEQPLRTMVEAAGGDWGSIKTDWTVVKSSIDSRKAELNSSEVKDEISRILENVTEAVFPSSAKTEIQKVFTKASPWAMAKVAGRQIIPSGEATQAFTRLAHSLRALGIFVVEVGELEGFARSVGNHGPKWVNEVLKKDIAADEELEDARLFVRSLISG